MDTAIYARIMALVAEMNSLLVCVEGMKAANCQFPEDQPYPQSTFDLKADQLGGIAQALGTLGY